MLNEQHIQRMKSINSIEALLAFLRDELDWPIDAEDVDSVTYAYEPEDVGLKEEHAPKINKVYQIRPVTRDQPWGIFFIDFENKKLPVTLMRRILNHLRVKNRGGGQWDAGDLLFMTTYGEEVENMREVAFAHFHQEAGDLPTLNVLQWDAQVPSLRLNTLYETLKNSLGWPQDSQDKDGWRTKWRAPFIHRIDHSISTSKALAEKLAELSRQIRDRVKEILEAENEKGSMTKLYTAFKSALVHDLKPEDFADTFAQTITYGLFSAAVSRRLPEEAGSKSLTTDTVAEIVPETSPFLREVLATFLDAGGRKKGGIDFDEVGIQEVVDLLRSDQTNMRAILENFGNLNQGQDPVIYFYEQYLTAYDKKLKAKRGVFYTPQEVVSYIVRSVHELLQTEFGLPDGLASTATWAQMSSENPEVKIPHGTDPESPFVVILDPAVGTATFLVKVIDVIFEHLKARWHSDRAGTLGLLKGYSGSALLMFSDFWNEYVPEHLLPRLYGYELMMAPYAIAHMKIGLKLRETGFNFKTLKPTDRVRVYLTNALEPAGELQARLALDWEALAHEALAVKAVKETARFTLVIGNPPYSKLSANLGPDERALVEPYRFVNGVRVHERGALALEMNLQDDYVKFIRFAETKNESSGIGLVAMITNHGYVSTPTLRGLRWSLLTSFTALWILDLHGHSGKGERTPAGGIDQNVFDIQQGVAIFFGIKKPGLGSGFASSRHSDLFGIRDAKYERLRSGSLRQTHWKEAAPVAPAYLLFPRDARLKTEFDLGIPIDRIFSLSSDGIVTARDGLVIAFEVDELIDRISEFRDSDESAVEVCAHFDISPDSMGFDFEEVQTALRAESDLAKHITRLHYRPFDFRYLFYFRGLIQSMRWPVARQLSITNNLALAVTRQVNRPQYEHALVTRYMMEKKTVSHDRNTQVHPLFCYHGESEGGIGIGKTTNLSSAFLDPLARALGRRFVSGNSSDGPGGLFAAVAGAISNPEPVSSPSNDNFSPEAVFHYIYGILHSATYRSRYTEFLKIDFPRIPIPGGPEVFDALIPLGAELASLHLMESLRLDEHMTTFVESPSLLGEPQVEKVSYANGTVWVDKAQSIGFRGVPQDVWNFHIGGYQVCEKWLKDRGPKKGKPGRILSPEDIAHYQKIVVAISETIRIMKEIDEVIEQHGGWPGAFQGPHSKLEDGLAAE